MRLALQPVALVFEPGPLAAHLLQTAAGIIEVGLGREAERPSGGQEQHQDEEQARRRDARSPSV